MELFGIVFSIPVAFVTSMVYCAILAHVVRRAEWLRRWLYAVSLVFLLGFLGEVALLATLGAVGSRAFVGPAFYVAHVIFFFLGTPALANALLLRKRGPVVPRWYLAGALCTAFAFCLVLLQYGVSETLYGNDGMTGPYSGAPATEVPGAVRADLEYLKAFVRRDPEGEASSSIGKGNLKFLGVAGFSVRVPSGDEPDIGGCLEGADKVELIRGTSDVIYGDEHMALIQQATEYAARYNALIARQRGLRTAGGCRSPQDRRQPSQPGAGR